MSVGFDAAQYLTDAYQGEVLGEAFFALLAEREREAEPAAKWRLLERLERHVKGRLRAELERRGIDASEDRARVDEGRAGAAALGALPWQERLGAFRNAVCGFVAGFETAAQTAPAELKEIAGFVLQHEQALLSFAERELGGEGATSCEPVSAFLDATAAEEERPLPDGIRLTALDDDYRDDPYPILAELRRRAPVHWDRDFHRFVFTRHDDNERVLRDLSFWVDIRKSSEEDHYRRAEMMQDREPSMLGLDDPEHKRLRLLVSRAFTPRAVEKWRPVVHQVALELLDAVEKSAEAEFDLVQALAAPLPAIAIARLLGVDSAQQADFKKWSEASVEAGFNPFASEEQKARAERARQALDACFRAEIEKRRAHPGDDLIGKMVLAEEEGDQLTERELVTMCDLLLVAGNVTTSDLIGNGVRALLENPDQLGLLQRRPELLPNAIEEMLRYDPPVTESGRIAPRDIEIGGVAIRQGQSITTVLAAANRDPEVYPDPDRFDIAREDTHHQSFGGGAHLCLGAHLARLETEEAIGGLVARFPRLRRSERSFTYKRVPGFRGLAEYWVRRD
ncbi:MAG: cytochrome P450 [Myxococcota bacterium]